MPCYNIICYVMLYVVHCHILYTIVCYYYYSIYIYIYICRLFDIQLDIINMSIRYPYISYILRYIGVWVRLSQLMLAALRPGARTTTTTNNNNNNNDNTNNNNNNSNSNNISMSVCVYMYICIYIYRERERKRCLAAFHPGARTGSAAATA